MKLAYFTICSRNYFAYALTLRASLMAAVPGAAFYVFLADEPFDDHDSGVTVIPASDLALPDYWDMAFRYSILEFNTSIKPFAFSRLFDRLGFDAAIYLDPDIFVYRPLEHVVDALESGAEAVLTPHITAPLEGGRRPETIDIMRAGTFNLGFAAFANRPEARRFIAWWAERCAKDCFVDPAAGLFVDQRFADLAPSFIERAEILRHPGYNVAYWNLAHRSIKRADGKWTAGGAQLHFFHFSGVDPNDSKIVSAHQNRFRPEDLGDGRALLDDYRRALFANGHASWSAIPYAYAFYSDGIRIPIEARRIYARRTPNGAGVPAARAVFNGDHEALNAPSPLVDQADAPISVLMHEIWRSRPDLQENYPLATGAGRRGFHAWFLAFGEAEHGIDRMFMAPATKAMTQPMRAARLGRSLARRLPAPVGNLLRRVYRLGRRAHVSTDA